MQKEKKRDPLPVQASLSSCLDETMSGAGVSPSHDDFQAHQELMKIMASNLSLEVELFKESSHCLVDILTTGTPLKVALPLSEAIIGPVKACGKPQPPYLPPQSESYKKVFCSHSRICECLYSHSPPRRLVVSAANGRDRKGQQAATPKTQRLDFFSRKVYSMRGSSSSCPISRNCWGGTTSTSGTQC